MTQPAIRNTDVHLCPAHGGEKIGAAAQLDITVNNEAGLHVGLGFTCGGQPTRVASGSTTVRFHGEFAARAFDDSGHQGKLMIGSGNVVIGGPRGVGCVGAGTKLCEQAAKGRKSGRTKQSYGNCVLESLRQLLLQTGHDVTEDDLAAYATAQGWFAEKDGVVNGGDHGVQLLEEFGVAAERVPPAGAPELGDVKRALSEGRGVIAFVDGPAWFPGLQPSPGKPNPQHAIVVTGAELDEHGNVVAVFVNDTGASSGNCGQRVPAARFGGAMKANGNALVVTKGAIW